MLDLNEKDNCGLTAWVADIAGEGLDPRGSLAVIILLCVIMVLLTVCVEVHVLSVIKPNMSFEDDNVKFLRTWRKDVTKIPRRVRAVRCTSTNIWYIPLVTAARVNRCANFYQFQSSLPM